MIDTLFHRKACKLEDHAFKFGRTKVFIRDPRTVFQIEDMRRSRMQDLATLIQKVFRGHVCRREVPAVVQDPLLP